MCKSYDCLKQLQPDCSAFNMPGGHLKIIFSNKTIKVTILERSLKKKKV